MTNPQTGADAGKHSAHADDTAHIDTEYIDTEYIETEYIETDGARLARVGLSELREVVARIVPMQAHAAAAAKSLATLIAEHPATRVRLVVISRTDSLAAVMS